MSVKERTQDLNMVVELIRTHLSENLKDNELCKDICSVVAVNLRRVHADAEQSAKAWDKRTFFSKADDLRTEMAWAAPPAQIVEAMAYSAKKFDAADCARLNDLLRGRIGRFSVDALLKIATKAGIGVSLELKDAA